MISAEKIPNNVDLSSNKRLQRALEHWQPKYIQWWRDMGPQGFQDYHQVYVRTAVSVDPEGWAHFEYVKLPEYRWGIFLADPTPDRRIGFGDFFGQPVWHEVPGEFRNQLRRLIVTQGDTEPASVEQQRWLGQRCPSIDGASSSPIRCRIGASGSAIFSASRYGRKCRESSAPSCGASS